jgi:hypothetical protein
MREQLVSAFAVGGDAGGAPAGSLPRWSPANEVSQMGPTKCQMEPTKWSRGEMEPGAGEEWGRRWPAATNGASAPGEGGARGARGRWSSRGQSMLRPSGKCRCCRWLSAPAGSGQTTNTKLNWTYPHTRRHSACFESQRSTTWRFRCHRQFCHRHSATVTITNPSTSL